MVVALEMPSLWETNCSTACQGRNITSLSLTLTNFSTYDSFLHWELPAGQLQPGGEGGGDSYYRTFYVTLYTASDVSYYNLLFSLYII